jgi:serine-type D-Ala-D-Ala carboxypeptidase/endopeptidase
VCPQKESRSYQDRCIYFMNPKIYQPLPVPGDEEIREILAKRIDQQKQAVGIVVGVIEPTGRRVVAYGNLANGDPRPLDGDTIFEIGSVTKVFTSLLLADMVNRREVTLDDPAARYLPGNVKMPERSGKSITLHDLSTHTSGLPFLPGNFKPKDYTVDDLYQFLSGYELPRDPGSEFEYSNLGAGLLGRLLANRAGTGFERLIGTRITQPLNMLDTGIVLSASVQQRMATGHNGVLAPAATLDLPTLAGAGALRSSANDMLTFLEAFLGYKESSLAPAMRAMLEFRRPALKAQIGLGWLFNSVEGKEIAWHNGRTAGFQSVVGFDPKTRTGVVVLANASTPSGVDDIGGHLLNPRVALANPEPPRQRSEIPIDPKLFDHYTGRYQATPNLIFEITRDGDHLFAQSFVRLPDKQPGNLTGMPKLELFAEGENKFFAKVADNQVTFETAPNGRAERLIMRRTGRDMPPAARLP